MLIIGIDNEIVMCCDNCRTDLNDNEIKRLRWEARTYKTELANMVHFCTSCQVSFDANFKYYEEMESGQCGY